MWQTFDEWWSANIEESVTANRARRFAKAAWDVRRVEIDRLQKEIEQLRAQLEGQ